MCEYCENCKTGNDYNPMIEKVFSLGIVGELFCDVVLTSFPDDEAALSLQYSTNSGSYDHGGLSRIKINYCPICGEKLGGVE